MLTWPSPAITTRPRWRSDRMVVARIVSGWRVGAVIRFHERAEVDVGVALRGGEARVAEEVLDGAEVGAGAEEVRRERVPEGVRRRLGGRSAREHVPVDQASTLREVRRPPRALRNTAPRTAGQPALAAAARYVSTARSAGRPTGTTRSFRPLPRTRTRAASVSRCSQSRPVSSLTRSPEE